MNETIKKLPWLTCVVIIFFYCLYGWGLTVISAPILYWAIAFGASAFLSMTITYSFLVSLPTILLASIFVITPLLLDVSVIRGGDVLLLLVNNFRNVFLFATLAVVIAMLWFSPLFWSHRVLKTSDLSTKKIIGILTFCSWVGLGLGRLLGIWY
ncbi:hypothetical protein Syn7502_00581 [Synechococcus sp. PCC 7502]|uniref:hypothetical protein n=1 Tax=Synechococcus sp. PCC 7502 TaxID=1173263 RepID=UPI00029F91CC|nr:hypothetical protein [Synechococcus sp. PCC 7502]AFY72731.1 hypothetical protein Syn7502_00581 [Synechococcus sp. PCC 7502]